MADFWIKLEKNTPDKPEIFEMAEILSIDPDAVLGKLIRVWCWVDSNSSDGHIKSVTPVLIDRLTMSQGFADAMTSVGWLEENSIPNFARHLGESAKKRAKDSERKRMSRTTSEDCPKKSVTESGLDKSRVDKIIEDKQQKKKAAVKNDLFDVFWKEYPKTQGKAQALKTWKKLNPNQHLFDLIISSVVKFKSSNEWKKDGGQFIPNASTWLNGERWEDELTYGAIPNGQDRPKQHIKETPLERMARKQKSMDMRSAPPEYYGQIVGENDTVVSTQMGIDGRGSFE